MCITFDHPHAGIPLYIVRPTDPDDLRSVVIQDAADRATLAREFGCPDSANPEVWLTQNAGSVADDPGYFTGPKGIRPMIQKGAE